MDSKLKVWKTNMHLCNSGVVRNILLLQFIAISNIAVLLENFANIAIILQKLQEIAIILQNCSNIAILLQ